MLSIIVPVYNSSQYLRNCINSILEQSYKKIEIILVNDGSTDNSLEICNEFREKDNRIIVLSQKNRGPGAAKNLGLEKAKGNFITFVDSDDSIDKFTYKENIAYLNKNPSIDIIQYPYIRNYTSSKEELFSPTEQTIHGKENLFYHWLTLHNISWIFCNKIFKASFIKKIRFPEDMFFEDNYLLVEVLSRNPIIKISKHGKYYYYKRDNSITTSYQGNKKNNDTIRVNLFILKTLSSMQLKKAKVKTLNKLLNNTISQKTNNKKIPFLFNQYVKGISIIDILSFNTPILEKLKLLTAKAFGLSFLINLYNCKQIFTTFDSDKLTLL